MFPTHEYDDTFFECEGADDTDLEEENARLQTATELLPVPIDALHDIYIDDEMPAYSTGRYWAVVKLFPVVIIPSRADETLIDRCAC